MKGLKKSILPFLVLLLIGVASAQQRQGSSMVNIEHADYLEGSSRFGKNVQALFGNVRFRHHQTLMFCDSAFFYRDSNRVHAYGNIHIIQNDTIHLYGDTLYYYGFEDKAMVRSNVKLVNKDVVLTTHFLDYNRRSDVAYYFNRGQIVSGDNRLVSDWGYYYPQTDEAHFRKEVVVTNPDYTMYSDTLLYYTVTEVVKIVGPTTIISDRNEIYSELGSYDTHNDVARLEKNSYVKGEEQLLKGDTIFYDRKSGFGEVFSSMFLLDSANHVIITGDYGYYNELEDKALATRNAVMMQISENDTLYLHADTLRADPIEDTEYRIIRAYHNVKFFRHDFQGRCDSMVYDLKDSINTFYKNPIIWANLNQMSAGTIRLYTRNKTVYKAEMIDNAFVVAPEDTAAFNQIKGRNMTGYIRNNELYRIDVEGNGQTIYYPKDEDEVIGVNRAESSNLTLLLENRKVVGIVMRSAVSGNMNPPLILEAESTRLQGFRWLEEFRPKRMEDIFIKSEGPEPVEQVNYSDFHFDTTMP